MRGFHEAFFSAFPDIHYRVDRISASGDSAMVECRVTGTNSAGFMGMPTTNKGMNSTAAFVVDTKDRKVKE